MSTERDNSDDAILDAIAEELVTRARRGEQPVLEEYLKRFPQLAPRLRAIWSSLVVIEKAAVSFDTQRLHLPRKLGDYRILRFLGGGAMGVVYEAIQESLGRHVAIKILKPNLHKSIQQRFYQEAQSAASLTHPAIVTIHGIENTDQLHYMVMNYIDGQGLNTVVHDLRQIREIPSQTPTPTTSQDSFFGFTNPESRSLDDEQSIATRLLRGSAADYHRRIARSIAVVAEGLAHAHDQGIIHRDVKPSNLLMDHQLRIWIVDFGLAKVTQGAGISQTGELIGTLRYMSPERFQGVTSPATDIYSLGATLYELLTLRFLFPQQDKVELQYAICLTRPIPPRVCDATIPRDLETIVLKATSRDVADRYATMQHFALDLRAFLAHRPIVARRRGARERFARWMWQHPSLASLTMLAFLVLVGASLLLFWQNQRLTTAMTDARKNERQAELKQLELLISEAQAVTGSLRPGQRFHAVKQVEEAIGLAARLGVTEQFRVPLRNTLARALACTDLDVAMQWPGLPPQTQTFDIHTATGVFLRSLPSQVIEVCSLQNNRTLRLLRVGEPGHWTGRFSPDGRWIVAFNVDGSRTEVHRWADGIQPQPITLTQRGLHAFGPKPHQFLYATRNATVTVWNLETQQQTEQWPRHEPDGEWRVVVHPQRPRGFLFDYKSRRMILFDTETLQTLDEWCDVERPTGAVWSPDGETIFVGGHSDRDGKVFLVRFDVAHDCLNFTDNWPVPEIFTQLVFNPAGDRLACSGWANIVALIDPSTGRLLESLSSHRDGVVTRWHPDGLRLAGFASGEQIGVWNVADAREFRVIPLGGTKHAHHLTVHPAGRWAAVLAEDQLLVFDTNTGRLLQRESCEAFEMAFRPSGDWVACDRQGWIDRRVQADEQSPNRIVLGPIHRDPVRPQAIEYLSANNTSKLWVNPNWPLALLERADRPNKRIPLPIGERRSHVSLSPDGHWAVTAHHDTHNAELWDLKHGTRVRRLYERSGGGVAEFSPCGRWLWINTGGGQLLQVGTWKRATVTGSGLGRPAFSTDGNLIALETGTGSLRILRTTTGELLLELQNPKRDPLHGLLFSSNNQRLMGISQGRDPGVHVWELSRIRNILADKQFDWLDTAPHQPAD